MKVRLFLFSKSKIKSAEERWPGASFCVETLSQETCRGAEVVPGMPLEETVESFSSADSEFAAALVHKPVLLAAM